MILGDATIAGLIGSACHWQRRPADERGTPYVVLQVIAEPADYTYAGASGFNQTTVQIDTYAKTYTAAMAVHRAILSLLSGFSGDAHGVTFHGMFVENRRDQDANAAATESQLFRVSADIEISWAS